MATAGNGRFTIEVKTNGTWRPLRLHDGRPSVSHLDALVPTWHRLHDDGGAGGASGYLRDAAADIAKLPGYEAVRVVDAGGMPWIVEWFGGGVGVLKPATWRHCGLRDGRPNCSEYARLLTFTTAEEAWDWMRWAAGKQFDTGGWRINRLPERTG